MSGRFFCVYCGSANFPSAYAHSFECKQCNSLIEIPQNQSTNQSVVSSPTTPSAVSTISSRCSSATDNESLSPISHCLPDLHLESVSSSDEESEEPLVKHSNNPTSKKRRRSSGKKRDPRAPKRAANAYMLFCKHERPLLRVRRPDLPFAIIGQTLGDMWRSMTIEQRAPYEARAAKDRERYKMEMHAFTAQTLRNNAAITPLINQTLQRMNFSQAINQSINQSINQWSDQSNNQEVMMPHVDSMMHQSIKHQSIPLMVQQAQNQYIRRYHPYNRPFNQSNDPNNQQWQPNTHTLNVERVNQSNNHFQYGPVKPERRFSYQSNNQLFNHSNNGLISNMQANNQPFNQTKNQFNAHGPIVYENFSSFEPSTMTQSINQYDLPNDCLDLETANFGLWEQPFDEL